jgi:DNA-binding transcriptional ArsR family regulator
MLTYEIVPEDLPRMRFGISPLTEMCLSLRALRAPTAYRHPLARTHIAGRGADAAHVDVLAALVTEDFSTPDFLTPRPESPQPRLHDELTGLVRLPTASVMHTLDVLWDSCPPQALRGPSWSVRSRLVEALERYWTHSFARFWVEYRSILAADIRYRASEMVDRGLVGAFASLAPHVRLEGDRVHAVSLAGPSYAVALAGRDLVFVPSFFTLGASYPTDPTSAPMVIYPTRGQGLSPSSPATTGTQVLMLLGAARARLLSMLETPTTTAELSASLGKTSSAVNQQLHSLRECGLVEASRAGQCVLYRRTEVGDLIVSGLGSSIPPAPWAQADLSSSTSR